MDQLTEQYEITKVEMPTASASSAALVEFKTTFAHELARLSKRIYELPWENKGFYTSFLTQTYYFVRHSTRLLALASARTGWDEETLHRWFALHIGEERGHDRLALADVEQLSKAELEKEMPETRNLYETQYYKVDHDGASTFIGYILALEGVASQIIPGILPTVSEAHGDKAARFLKLHAEEDPDHVDQGFHKVGLLSAEQIRKIQFNFVQSAKNYEDLLVAIARQALSFSASKSGHSNISSTFSEDTNPARS